MASKPRQSAHLARHDESHLDALFRARHRRNRRGFWHAGFTAHASRIAGLAGSNLRSRECRVRNAECGVKEAMSAHQAVEPESDAPPHRQQRNLSPIFRVLWAIRNSALRTPHSALRRSAQSVAGTAGTLSRRSRNRARCGVKRERVAEPKNRWPQRASAATRRRVCLHTESKELDNGSRDGTVSPRVVYTLFSQRAVSLVHHL